MKELEPLERFSPKPVAACVLRLLLERRDAGLEIDPWLPFPQKHCCFSFGPQKGPVPVGALFLVWSAGPPYAQTCPDCKATAYMVSFGGLLSSGGGRLVCPACGMVWFQFLGGLGRVADWLTVSPLMGTVFKPTGMVFGAAFCSDGGALRALLGVAEPPDEGEGVSFGIVNGPAFSMELEFEKIAPKKEG